MATIKIDQHGAATITMANGSATPVPPKWNGMELDSGASPYRITWANGVEFWITTAHQRIDGMADRNLEDGETFTSHDGCTWTRHGDEMLVVTPEQLKVAA